ncbi:hypothetical protein [Rhizobium sp. RU36D]|uniref:hypothetical protein n=1 Tax=Rhizobium sp. RU36D TaxID=1907415 RepID=UPI0009D7AD04|nr:hypothetical protein [Rhizobium sp. RU36D]SMD14969.1 hypothetical protein SAMN05880593_1274 [Rhizobium sp. RU36D]
MPSQYDENDPRNANPGRRNNPGIHRDSGEVRKEFNFEAEFGERLASLSPEGRQSVDAIARHGTDRLEREMNDQRRSHKYRVAIEENRRLKDLVRHPELRLGDIKLDGQSEITQIEDLAKKTVTRREENYRENIREETRYSIEREMSDDRQRRERGPDYDVSRDDPERER